MDNIFNSIVGVVIGVFMIIAWLPTIFFTEINNKGNRLEMEKLKGYLNESEFKTKAGILTGDGITSDIKYDNTTLDSKFTKGSYIYIYYTGTLETTTTTADNKTETNIEYVSKSFKPGDIKWNTTTTITDEEQLKHLSSTIGEYTFQINNTKKLQLTFYGIILDTNASMVEGLKIHEKDIDMTVFDYELGADKETVIRNIINRKSDDNTVQKWLGRIGTFLLLCLGLMALISPLRYAINTGSTIPGLNFILTPFRWLIGLYDVASFIIAIILTILMTLFVYALVNYPIISLLLGGLTVGLGLYLKK